MYRSLRFLNILVLLWFLPLVACSQSANLTHSFEITVTAGDFDRNLSVVSIAFPDAVHAGTFQATSQKGETTYIQIDDQNTGWLLINHLKAGSSITYTVSTKSVAKRSSSVKANQNGATLDLTTNGTHVLSYFYAENSPPDVLDVRYRRGGYIHPVYSPGGVVLTDHLNTKAHSHHSGIWSAWTNTVFQGRTPDFWNVHQDKGRVDLHHFDGYWSGEVQAGFTAVNKFIDLTADESATALLEQWTVRVYATPKDAGFLMFDIELVQTMATADTLFLPEYRYGGVGFRGHADWTDNPETTTFLTSDGLGRDGHGTRARWAHIGGFTDGNLAGIAVLGHPQNYRFPQTMRIHPNEPFFNFAPVQMGDMMIVPGKPYVTKQRFVTYDGTPVPHLIDAIWNDYAYPPGVTVKRVDK